MHIMKTGGTSVRAALPFEEIDIHRSLKHYTVRHIVESVGLAAWQAAFTFTFVRDPWERLASLHRYLLAKGEGAADRIQDFKPFIRRVLLKNAREFEPALATGMPQVEWLRLPSGEIDLSFIGRQENLQQDFQHVLDSIGLPPQELPVLNTTSKAKPDVLDLYDAEMRGWVLGLYEEDFDVFKYPRRVDNGLHFNRTTARQVIHPPSAEAPPSGLLHVRIPGVSRVLTNLDEGPWSAMKLRNHWGDEVYNSHPKFAVVDHPARRLFNISARLMKWAQVELQRPVSRLEALELIEQRQKSGAQYAWALHPQTFWLLLSEISAMPDPSIEVIRFDDLPECPALRDSINLDKWSAHQKKQPDWTAEELAVIERIHAPDYELFGYSNPSVRGRISLEASPGLGVKPRAIGSLDGMDGTADHVLIPLP